VEKIQSAGGSVIAFDRYGGGEPLVTIIGATTDRAINPNLADVAIMGTGTVIRTGEQGEQ
jgi:hypothetical protein